MAEISEISWWTVVAQQPVPERVGAVDWKDILSQDVCEEEKRRVRVRVRAKDQVRSEHEFM